MTSLPEETRNPIAELLLRELTAAADDHLAAGGTLEDLHHNLDVRTARILIDNLEQP